MEALVAPPGRWALARLPPTPRRPRAPPRPLCAARGTELPATYGDAIVQARSSLRAAREVLQSELQSDSGAGPPPRMSRLLVEMPVPPPGGAKEGDAIAMFQESDWPGGLQQRHRYVRPVVEALLAGWGVEFVGCLEGDADGLGVWKTTSGITAASQVVNATFPGFLKLCQGKYGARVLERGHTLLVVNPGWTKAADLGQLWDRKLRSEAAVVLDRGGWETVYCHKPLRTPNGINGTLHRCYPGGWLLYSRPDAGEGGSGLWGLGAGPGPRGPGEGGGEGEGEGGASPPRLLLEAEDRPTRAEITRVLTEAGRSN